VPMNNNAWGRGCPKRCRSRRAENITHPCLTPSLGKRAPCSHPFDSLAGFRIITRHVAPHNATFQQTIYIIYNIYIYKYIEICQTFACVSLRPLSMRTPYHTYAFTSTPHSYPSTLALVISSTTGIFTYRESTYC